MDQHESASPERSPSGELSDEEAAAVADRKADSPVVVHEAVRLQGQEELSRSAMSLILSALAAGLAMAASVLGQAILREHLPDRPWAELIVGLGYPAGYVIAILGQLQLFTESTVTAVLPLATHPTGRNLARLARLWALVLLGNLLGTLVAAAMIATAVIVTPEQARAAAALSGALLAHTPGETLLLGIPAGFLVGAIAWLLANARTSAFAVVVMITYLVGIGGFSHVVAGSAEAWLLWLAGRASLGWALWGFIGPALIGNIIGGTGLFAVLAHGQVRSEL